MTSDEIKKRRWNNTVALTNDETDARALPLIIEHEHMDALWEIALQLAELNEHFRAVDKAVFGS